MATIRLAASGDAAELARLNEQFNGEGSNAADAIEESLLYNGNELVCVAEHGGRLVGFCCGQAFWSMCYADRYAEITELYVEPEHRHQGLARAMIGFVEARYRARGIAHFQLFTGGGNTGAQALYRALRYEPADELMFRKRP